MKLPEYSSVPIFHVLLREVCMYGYSKKSSLPVLHSSRQKVQCYLFLVRIPFEDRLIFQAKRGGGILRPDIKLGSYQLVGINQEQQAKQLHRMVNPLVCISMFSVQAM